MNVLIVIPARGGSKGIPRKALRPLAGFPLIKYAITAAVNYKNNNKINNCFVIVSTDDDEMALMSERFGAEVLYRDLELSTDNVTLDPVIKDATEKIEIRKNTRVDVVVTIQPTSPLVTEDDITKTVEIFSNNQEVETVVSVVDDRHLRWKVDANHAIPDYEKRVNRQSLPKAFKETGAVIACRRNVIKSGTRIGANVKLLEIPYERSFDIDSVYDWYVCESILRKKRIVFNVIGYPVVGLGHVYRALMLANELILHDVKFVVDKDSNLAANIIRKFNYSVEEVEKNEVVNLIKKLQPDLVINDILDTQSEYMDEIKKIGCKIINFEDLGEGSKKADLVINALYPAINLNSENIKSGPYFFCLRDEFLFAEKNNNNERVSRVLLTFGGVDEGNLTARVLDNIVHVCRVNGIYIDIVLGPGYKHTESLIETINSSNYERITLIGATSRISDYMMSADVAITSGGRTVLELAALTVPAVVICQNERETTHIFADYSHGVINLGYREEISDAEITSAFEELISNSSMRLELKENMKSLDLSKGKSRVISLINEILN